LACEKTETSKVVVVVVLVPVALLVDTVITVQQCKCRWIGHILRHDSVLCDIIEGRMLDKATKEKKRLRMLSDISSKTYEAVKREAGRRECREPAIWQKTKKK